MVDEERLGMKWFSYTDHLREMLHGMMTSADLTDVTLVCDDQSKILAHKVVLSACSPVFKSMIGHNAGQQQTIIFLRGVQQPELVSILQYMYLGQTAFIKERLEKFLAVARDLKLMDFDKNAERHSWFDNTMEGGEDKGEMEQPQKSSSKKVQIKTESVEFETNFLSKEEQGTQDKLIAKAEGNITEEQINDHDKPREKISPTPKQTLPSKFKAACEICQKRFVTKLNLKIHMQLHKTVQKVNEFGCKLCDFKAKTKSKLKLHEEKHKKNILEEIENIQASTYPCSDCDFDADSVQNLKLHINKTHSKLSCRSCDYQTAYPDFLQEHLKLSKECST